MKGMQKIRRGAGFRGAVSYAIDRDGENIGQVIGGNMDGGTVKELTAEFKVSRSMRPDCKKPVWHNALRLPKGEKIDLEQWRQIADDYMQRMGFGADHQRVYVMHDDPDGQHVHIIASRIALDGSLYYGQNENLASTQHIAELEREHGLTISPEPDPATSGQRRRLTKGEVEMAIRTEEAPAKLILQNAIDSALSDGPTTGAFIERLQAAGITPRPNVASTGRMNGFSFELDGIAFKASSLGKSYSFQNLIKRGLDYEQTRDSGILVEQTKQSDQRADQRTAAVAGAERRELGAADRAAGAVTRGAIGREPQSDLADRPRVAQSPEAERRPVERRSGEYRDRAQGPGRSDEADHQQHRPSGQAVAGSDGAGLDSSDQHRDANRAGAVGRVHDLAAPAVTAREGGASLVQQSRPGESGASSDRRAPAPVAAHLRAKIQAWQQQHEALQAPAYRLTLTARHENLQTFNFGKGKAEDGGEKFYTAEEVDALLPQLSRQNARGYDIYITPISDQRHYIVLDDTDADRLRDLHQRTGITPALVQESSPGNLQAVIVADKHPGPHEQSNANYLVQGLNKQWGDPKFTGVIHPFRLSGFMNQKPVYERNGQRPIVRPRPGIVKTSPGNAADQTLNAMLDKQRQQQAEQEQKQNAEQKKGRELRISEYQKPRGTSRGDAEQRYMEYARSCVEFVREKGWPLDWSRVDFYCCKEMLKDGYFSEKQIEAALKNCSPELFNRHRNVDDYAVRTVLNAAQEPDVIAHLERQHSISLLP